MNIKETIAKMTLEEKCSMLSGQDFWHTQGVERVGIKPCMVSDGPHGLRKQNLKADHLGVQESIKAVCFPAACATAASFDPELTKELGENIGDACQHEELSVILGPAVNIKRSPLCGRNFEYFSEDPYLAGVLASSMVQGVQSRNVGVSVKHFAANSQEHRRMSTSAEIDERTLREIYLNQFERIVKTSHPWTIMCSYNKINGTYMSENKKYLTDVLRGEWGFDGYVMSDWGAVSNRVDGVAAGLDLEMPTSGGANDKRVLEAVKSGKLPESVVDTAVERILTINERYLNNAKPETEWDMEAQHENARRMAAECMVLLKNDNNVLPLKKDRKLAVIGKFAKTPRYQGGGSSHINSFKVTSLMDCLEGNENVTYCQGYDIVNEAPDGELIAQAVEAAKKADYAVIVAGLPDSFESEGYDRTHMRMPICQNELIHQVARVNQNTIVILCNGSPVEMPWAKEVSGIIEAYLGGQAVGGAMYDVLTGKVNPSGKLPETFPVKLEDNPSYLSYGGEGNVGQYNEGVFVGYRYYDKKKMDVLFPFGFGLSYTTFEYTNMTVDKEKMKDTDTLTVTVDVTNTGKIFGKEVVELYVGDVESTVFRPVRELKGIAKVALEAGETKTVTFTLSKRDFAYWNTQLHDWHVESGEFTIDIGQSSRKIVASREVYVESTVEIPVHFTMDSIFMDIIKSPKAMAAMQPVLMKLGEAFGAGNESKQQDEGEAAKEAITAEMSNAMIQYSPLRSVVSFSGGKLSFEMLQGMLDMINNG